MSNEPQKPIPARAAAERAGAAAASGGGTEVPVSSLNPGGRPAAAPQAPALQVLGTLNSGVEIRAEPSEDDNIKKLLGGLGAYQNPARGNTWQVDYRYYAEARRRLEAAGYTLTEEDYLGRSLSAWNPVAGGWTSITG